METKLTEQDSLRIINEMIAQTKNNIQQGSADTIIFAGYCVAGTAILNFILSYLRFGGFNSSWVWLLMIPMTIGCVLISKKNRKKAVLKTHVDNIVSKIWFAFLISVICILVSIFGYSTIFKTSLLCILITPTILILMGLAQYVTAVSIRFEPFLKGAYTFWIGSILCIICSALGYDLLQFIILALCMIIGFVLPGYKLNSKANQNV